MSLRPSYPDISVGSGFRYCHASGHEFRHPILVNLHRIVSEFYNGNGWSLNNDEFDDNVCRNTPNIVCTEGLRGAGDLAHVVLNPISKLIDSALGTNLQGCGGCWSRQNAMNK